MRNKDWWKALFVIAMPPISLLICICVLVYREREDIIGTYKFSWNVLTNKDDPMDY